MTENKPQLFWKKLMRCSYNYSLFFKMLRFMTVLSCSIITQDTQEINAAVDFASINPSCLSNECMGVKISKGRDESQSYLRPQAGSKELYERVDTGWGNAHPTTDNQCPSAYIKALTVSNTNYSASGKGGRNIYQTTVPLHVKDDRQNSPIRFRSSIVNNTLILGLLLSV